MQNQQQLNNTKWVKDKEAKKCRNCESSFNTLFRRKHHCRNCGEVFCDSCSKYYLDRKYFKENERIKKDKVRLCKACYLKIIDNLRQNGEQIQQFKLEDPYNQMRRHSKSFNVNDKLPESATQVSTHISSLLDTKSNSIRSDTSTQSPIVIQEDELTKKQKKLEQNMNEIISQIITQAVQKCGIGDNWLATISQFLKQMMQDLKDLNVCPERILGQETIEKLIKIKVIPFINYQATRYIKGVMIRKNIAHKKMQTSFKNAKILLLWDSLDPNIQNFEALVKNEKKIIQQALEYIEKLGPNIILIEKSINNLILNQLQEKNITVSICCRQKQLQKIAEATSAKIQKALDIFRQNCDPDCLGTSERVVYINCDGESIRSNSQVYNSLSDINKSSLQCYLETKNLDSTILFICDPHSSRISLSVSGPKIDELKNIKQCFIQYIPLAYEVLLEYQMINLDLKLKRDLALLYKQQDTGVQMLTSGEIFDFSSFQQQNEGVQIQKITYHIGVKSKIYDVNKKKNSECLEQYIQNNLQNFNGKAIQKFCQMCDKQEEKKCFLESIKYQKNDITIGKYLAEKAIYDNQKCGKCNTKKIDHISIRYGPGGFFKCVVEKKKLELTLQNASENQPSKSVSDFNYIEGQDDGVQQEIQQIEQTSKQKVYQFNISTYLGCKSCNKLLTKQYQLGQQLEYSFFRLVQHSITNSIRQRKKLNMNWLEFHGQLENQEKEMQCSHPEIERIFECGDNLIKLSTNVFDIYSVKTFHFYTQEVEFHLKNFDRDEVSKRYDEISIILQKIQQFISVFLEQSNLRNSKFSMSSSVSIQTSSYIPQNQNQLPKILEEIAKIQERMKIYLYEDFISFECDCMQLFYNCNRMQNIIFPTSKPKQSDISMIKSTQIRQQTMMLEKEPQVKSYIFQRKTLKENSLIPQSQPIQINEYPIQQLSPQQFPYSPDSPVQDIEESTEISVGRISNENDQNGTFLKNIIKNWPRQALNWDQFSVNWSRQAQNFESTQPNNQFYNYLPIYSQGEVDLIASALNDSRYYYLYQQWQIENLWNKFQEFTVQKQSENCYDFQTEVTQILKEQPKLAKEIKEITLRVQKNPQLVQKQSSNNLQEDDQSVNDEESQSTIGLTVPAESPRKPQRQVQIQIFYPKQFECFRIMNGIHIKQFIKSILSCTNWNSAGGKSGSSFYKSADNLFIFKAVKPQEFETFEIFAPKYFIHMYNIFFNDKKSVLNKIYGMFTIKNSKGIQYFIAMENLFYGMAPDLLVYDLKGSGANRWNRKNQKTLLDTNYIIDRNGEPLPINEKDYEIVEKAFEFDSEFLLEVKVVDYSLLLIIDKMNHQIKLAIIDYLQDFDIKKRVENKFKTAINLGNEQPTIVSPKEYQERFIKAMQRYFMKIYSSL